jgi:hypothetical protein
MCGDNKELGALPASQDRATRASTEPASGLGPNGRVSASAGHTPGPWHPGWNSPALTVRADFGGASCRIATVDRGKSAWGAAAHAEANARLIAAAPELLEALREAHRALMHYEWYANPASGWSAPDKKFVRHMTDAAIAKATGAPTPLGVISNHD